MENRPISSIEDINAAIENGNPFEGKSTVRDAEIWGRNCPDLETFNWQTTSRIWDAIERAQSGRHRVRAVVAVAEPGMGKSHAIGRVRHQIRARGKGLFVYVNAQNFTNPNTIRWQLLSAIVNSLRYSGSRGVMQWQELAAFWVNRALFFCQPDSANLTPQKLVKKLTNRSLSQNQLWVNQVTEILFKAQPDLEHPDAIRAIIWTLCNDRAPFACNWLALRKLAQWKLDELGLPDRTLEHRESIAWETILQILQAIGDYASVTICFDRIDAEEPQETVGKKEQAIAACIDRLWDGLNQRERQYGVVLASVMTPTAWYDRIVPYASKFARRTLAPLEAIELETIDRQKIVEIVARWLQEFYSERNLIPPTPIYPFDILQFQALLREKLSLSEMLEWCAENFKPVEIDPIERVELAFERALDDDWSAQLERDRSIADALYFAFQTAIGQTIAGVEIEAVSDDVSPKTFNQNHISFKIIGHELGNERNEPIAIGVAVMGSERGRTVGAALKRLMQTDRLSLTRTCLVRGSHKPIPTHWQAGRDLREWIDRRQGKWIDTIAEALVPLLALHWIYLNRDTHRLEAAQILDFIRERRAIAQNPIVCQILQTPAPPTLPDLDAEDLPRDARVSDRAIPTPSNSTDPSVSPHPSSPELL
ncbi:MAG: hypothetical protein SWY16_20945 [Cyanobacteriota bacterium]|nr:hypothetical protein [Cyanobacteriota bacterium]